MILLDIILLCQILSNVYFMDDSLINFLNKYKIIEIVRSKKNFFEISGFPHYEIVFNNVLAFFMNSDECHNFGNLVFTSLLEILKEKNIINIIDDYTQYVIREESTINGKLIDILIMTIYAILCGQEDYVNIAYFMKLKEEVPVNVRLKYRMRFANEINDYLNSQKKLEDEKEMAL